jgi:hypothetical protein
MRIFIKKLFILFIAAIVVINSFGQSSNNSLPKIASELLKQDFIYFRDSLQQLHAGVYRYRSKKEIDKLFDSCFATLNHPINAIEYYVVISYLVSAVEDGHTSCALPSELMEYITTTAMVFPIQLRFINDKAYVSCATKEFSAATEILSVNNESINTIRKKLFQYLPSDGNIQTRKYWSMNKGNNHFSYLYYLIYGERHDFTVEYKTKEGKVNTTILNAGDFKNVQCRSPQFEINEPYLNLDFRHNDIAILTIKTFSRSRWEKANKDFYQFLKKAFEEIHQKNVKGLIIDLRDNNGGRDEYGSKLYSYLTDKPFKYYTSLQSTTKEFTSEYHTNLAIQKPSKDNYKGKVYFLINGLSFSTTAEFCSIAKSNERGKFIGEETGGGYYGNTSGPSRTIILPNTKISVKIPLHKYGLAVKNSKYKDRGIIPDYIITQSITDFINHKDIQLNFAIRLAEKDNSR